MSDSNRMKYGLVDIGNNAIVLIGDNYNAIKTIQYSIGSQMATYCFDLSLIPVANDNKVTPDNFHMFSASWTMNRFIEADKAPMIYSLTHNYQIDLRKNLGMPPIDNTVLRNNLQFVYKYLTGLLPVINGVEAERNKHIELKINGLNFLNEYVSVQSGYDSFLSEAIEYEQNKVLNYVSPTSEIKKHLYTTLSQINYSTSTNSSIINTLRSSFEEAINNTHTKFGRSSRKLLRVAISLLGKVPSV